jgi:hypothetical protein
MPDPFDPAKALAATRVVPTDRIVDLLAVTNAPERVAEFRLAMERGERFPPIAVIPLGGRFFITDGHKRFTACRTLVGPEVVVEIWGVRRLLADLWRQSRVQQRRLLEVFTGGPGDETARRRAVSLLAQNLAHWRRIGRSLWANLRGNR